MNKLQLFQNERFGTIRGLDIDGEPWFVGKDVAEALGYSNTRDALGRWVEEDDRADVAIHDGSQNRSMVIINESGLYSLIFSSKLPKAREFKRWVTSEVLPAIRKTGTYTVKGYPKKSTSAGEVASLVKRLDDIAKSKHCTGHERSEIANAVCEQFDVKLPACFSAPPEFEQMTIVCTYR